MKSKKQPRKADRNGWKPIRPRRCDLCPKTARWKHPAGGYRCDDCPRPGTGRYEPGPAYEHPHTPVTAPYEHGHCCHVHDPYAHMDGRNGDIRPQSYQDWIEGMERR